VGVESARVLARHGDRDGWRDDNDSGVWFWRSTRAADEFAADSSV